MPQKSISKNTKTSGKGVPYEYIEHDKYRMRTISLDPVFVNVEAIWNFLHELAQAHSLQCHGYLDNRDRLRPVSREVLENLFVNDDIKSHCFVLSLAPKIECSIQWMGPEFFDVFETPDFRIEVGISLDKESGWKEARRLFLAVISLLNPVWGELNAPATTKFYSFLAMNIHWGCVPHLGSANYFGSELLEFLGGMQHFCSAGFQTADAYHHGCYVELPAVQDHDAYLATREKIERHFHPEGIFSNRDIQAHPLVHFQGWADTPPDTTVELEVLSKKNDFLMTHLL